MFSTSDLAKRLKVSRQAVLKHYKQNKNKIATHSFMRKNRRMFDKTGTSIIIKSFRPNYKNSNQSNNDNDNLNLQIYNLLKTQLDRKDQQIKDLGQQLNQAQVLQQGTQRELDKSQNQLKLIDKREKHKNQLKLVSKQQKHGWIWKLFH